jgi:hypothetical protein
MLVNFRVELRWNPRENEFAFSSVRCPAVNLEFRCRENAAGSKNSVRRTQVFRGSGSGARFGFSLAADPANSMRAFQRRTLSSDCITNHVQNIDQLARGMNFAKKRHSRQHLHLVVRDVVDASKLFVLSELFPGRTLRPLRFSRE